MRPVRTIVLALIVLALNVVAADHGRATEVTAFIEPYRDIDVAAAEMGTLAAVLVKEGEQVSMGQLLGQLDDEVLQASRKMAQTAMQAHGKLHSATAELQMQTDRWQKLLGLRERQHASQQEVDRTVAQKEIAAANLESVHDELKLKEMEYRRIEAELQRRRLVSPINGVVTVIYKDVGEFVSSNDPIVIKVVQLDPLLAIMSVPMGLAGKLVANESVNLEIGGIPKTVSGMVEFVSPTADPQSGTVRVKIRIPNPQGEIPCGAPCRWIVDDASVDSLPDLPLPEPGPDASGPDDSRREAYHQQPTPHPVSHHKAP